MKLKKLLIIIIISLVVISGIITGSVLLVNHFNEMHRQEIIKSLNESYSLYLADVQDGVINDENAYKHIEVTIKSIGPNGVYTKNEIVMVSNSDGDATCYVCNDDLWKVFIPSVKDEKSFQMTAVYSYGVQGDQINLNDIQPSGVDYTYLVYGSYRIYTRSN